MYIFSLDTSNRFQISLLQKNVTVDSVSLDRVFFVKEKTNMSDVVLQYMLNMLSKNNLSVKDISLISIIDGAGFFTGLRISIVVAKVLKLALGIPVYSFHSSYILAQEMKKSLPKDNYIVVALDIGKSGCVLSVYNESGNILEDIYVAEEDLEEFFKNNKALALINAEKLNIIGSKQDIFKGLSYFSSSKLVESIVVPSLDVLAYEALSLYNKGEFQSKIEPFYAKEVDMIIK